MADEIEYVILNKKECFVYNVPPATSANGYKAADWTNSIWKGRIQLCAKGDILIIKLLDASSGAIFAACPIAPNVPIDKVVERTVDSSRYFVLTMTDKSGRRAFLGMGFDDRNDAFDFNASIQDYRRQRESASEVIQPIISTAPAPDLSLKEGQRISVQIKALQRPPGSNTVSSGIDFLPPPPTAKSRQVNTDSGDLLDIGATSDQPVVSRQSQPPAAAPVNSLLD
jgi:adaptin ear-binding coat-associated protein 1/2